MARLVTHRKRRDPFVRIEREVMEDPTLSFKAKALYGWMLDKGEYPGGWDTDVERIATITADGAFAIRGALAELEAVHRLERSDNKLGGRGKRAEWHIYDEPKPTENREVTDTSGAETAGDERGNRDSHLITERLSSSETTNAVVDMSFDAFWFAYPYKVDKPAARKAWLKALKKIDPSMLMAGLTRWTTVWAARGKREYIPYPATWLNGERWNDEPVLAGQHVDGGPDLEVAAALAKFAGHS